MKTFIVKSLLFFTIIVTLLGLYLINYGNYIDYFYNKFTTPKFKSLIVGDSRGLQGIRPKIIDNELRNMNFELPILNYSFTIAESHIGELYRKSILKKLDNNAKNGLYIISITPWMLSSKRDNNNYHGEFKESNKPPHNMIDVSMNPNFEYFIKNYDHFNFKGVFRKNSNLHMDGWLEAKNLPKDSITFKKWKGTQLNIFKGFTEKYIVSEYRKKSLDTLIKNLKKHGRVVLVRSPVDKDMLDLENSFFPNFNSFLKNITKTNKIQYFNFNQSKINLNFQTYDGHHLNKHGSKLFTQLLCDSIKLRR